MSRWCNLRSLRVFVSMLLWGPQGWYLGGDLSHFLSHSHENFFSVQDVQGIPPQKRFSVQDVQGIPPQKRFSVQDVQGIPPQKQLSVQDVQGIPPQKQLSVQDVQGIPHQKRFSVQDVQGIPPQKRFSVQDVQGIPPQKRFSVQDVQGIPPQKRFSVQDVQGIPPQKQLSVQDVQGIPHQKQLSVQDVQGIPHQKQLSVQDVQQGIQRVEPWSWKRFPSSVEKHSCGIAKVGSPRISALKVNKPPEPERDQELDGEDTYVFVPQGVVGESFELSSHMSSTSDEERLARIPDGVQAPVEKGEPCGRVDEGEPCIVASLDVVEQPLQAERSWFDALPGEPLYIDESPEDLVEADALLDELDAQRQVKLRVIREQESFLSYELGQGEGLATKEWLTRACVNLGELEAQMAKLQYEQLQRTGQISARMMPTLASLTTGSSHSDSKSSVEGLIPEPEVLHTHTVPLSEVSRDLSAWHPALLEEFSSILTTHRAIRPVSREELRLLEKDGREVLYVPGKLVATVKAGTGKRIVACGNFLSREKLQGSPTLSRGDIFAAGLDSLALRAQIAAAAWQKWAGGTVDIRTAFLTAPLQAKRSQRVVVLRPPKILATAGIVTEGSLYLIEKALYGLAESPQDWGAERDSKFRAMKWNRPQKYEFGLEQAKSDHSIWRIRKVVNGSFEGPVRGLLGVYVDDLLSTAELELLKGLLQTITKLWRCSDPQLLTEEVVFCGLQIQAIEGAYLICQAKYIRELQQRHPDIRASRTLPNFRDEEPPEESPNLAGVREAQKYMGELQWLACRSRPDISFSVSRASRMVAKNPCYAIKAARHVMAYLFETVDLKLKYGDVGTHPELAAELPYERSMGLVEAFSDASFGCEDGKSQSGVAVLLGSCWVAWLSVPQPFTTLSTCEAELVSACEALTLSQAIIPLWQEMTETTIKWVAITDSVAAASVLLYPSGSWRTRHLRLRCRAYQEMIEEEALALSHVKGQNQVADLLTKAMSPQRVKQLLEYLGCVFESKSPEEGFDEKECTTSTLNSQRKGVAKSLMVLSCLLSPVEAQPSRETNVYHWRVVPFWVFVCLVLLWVLFGLLLMGRLFRRGWRAGVLKRRVANETPWNRGSFRQI